MSLPTIPNCRRSYAEADRAVEITSGTSVWYHTGMPVVPIRWVLVRDPQAKFDAQAFLCTNIEKEPAQILAWFVRAVDTRSDV